MSEERAKQLAELVSKVSLHPVMKSRYLYAYHPDKICVRIFIGIFLYAYITQTKSAPNPDDMQNTGGDIMKKFAAVVKYERDDDIHPSIHHDNTC